MMTDKEVDAWAAWADSLGQDTEPVAPSGSLGLGDLMEAYLDAALPQREATAERAEKLKRILNGFMTAHGAA